MRLMLVHTRNPQIIVWIHMLRATVEEPWRLYYRYNVVHERDVIVLVLKKALNELLCLNN